jgi:hypothetical protein
MLLIKIAIGSTSGKSLAQQLSALPNTIACWKQLR